MIDMTVYLVLAAVLLAAGSWLVFIWAARSGQFREVEDVKHSMLERERELESVAREGDRDER